jgi:hypothetical protein
MAKDQRTLEHANEAMAKVAEQAMEQARGTADYYLDFFQKAMANPWGGTDLTEKLHSCAAENMAAVQDLVNKLGQAKTFQDVIRIQTDFMQTQLLLFAEQSKSFYEAYSKAAAEAMKTPFKVSP